MTPRGSIISFIIQRSRGIGHTQGREPSATYAAKSHTDDTAHRYNKNGLDSNETLDISKRWLEYNYRFRIWIYMFFPWFYIVFILFYLVLYCLYMICMIVIITIFIIIIIIILEVGPHFSNVPSSLNTHVFRVFNVFPEY